MLAWPLGWRGCFVYVHTVGMVHDTSSRGYRSNLKCTPKRGPERYS